MNKVFQFVYLVIVTLAVSCSSPKKKRHEDLIFTRSYYSDSDSLTSVDFVYESIDTNFYYIINEIYEPNRTLYSSVEVFKDYYLNGYRKQYNQIVYLDSIYEVVGGSWVELVYQDSTILLKINDTEIIDVISIYVEVKDDGENFLYQDTVCCEKEFSLPFYENEYKIVVRTKKRHHTFIINPKNKSKENFSFNIVKNFKLHLKHRRETGIVTNHKVNSKYSGNVTKISR